MKGKKNALFPVYILLFILLSSVSYAAIGATHPADMQLKPGQSDRFKFEIQAVSHPNSITCSYNLDKKTDFDVIFDAEGPVTIEAGGVALITGTVTVNETKSVGGYTRNIEVSCKDVITNSQDQGSAAVGVYNIFLNVDVVQDRTHENIYVSPPQPKTPLLSATMVAAILAALAIIVIVVLILITKRKKISRDLQANLQADQPK